MPLYRRSGILFQEIRGGSMHISTLPPTIYPKTAPSYLPEIREHFQSVLLAFKKLDSKSFFYHPKYLSTALEDLKEERDYFSYFTSEETSFSLPATETAFLLDDFVPLFERYYSLWATYIPAKDGEPTDTQLNVKSQYKDDLKKNFLKLHVLKSLISAHISNEKEADDLKRIIVYARRAFSSLPYLTPPSSEKVRQYPARFAEFLEGLNPLYSLLQKIFYLLPTQNSHKKDLTFLFQYTEEVLKMNHYLKSALSDESPSEALIERYLANTYSAFLEFIDFLQPPSGELN